MKHTVKMPLGDYLSEHKRLIGLLDNSGKSLLKREAKRQKAEVKSQLAKFKKH